MTEPALASERFAAHVAGVRFDDLPEPAVEAAKTWILDTLGVGIAGSSAAGMDAIRAAYAHAIEERYRFFSYGDAMLLTRQAAA